MSIAVSSVTRCLRQSKCVRSFSSFGNWDFSWVQNEFPLHYAPGSPERAALRKAVDHLYNNPEEVPAIINGKEVFSGDIVEQVMPTEHQHVVARWHNGTTEMVQAACDASVSPSAREWSTWSEEDRAAVFLKAAELVAGPYRAELSASVMLGTGKNPWQAEVDVAEISDFFRFAVMNMHEIYNQQPPSLYKAQSYWNRMEWRPLEGFVLAISPFNFAALGANLSGAPALMGNTIVWKPSSTAVHEGYLLMKIFKEAGLPDGVINFIPSPGSAIGKTAIPHPSFAGVNFTGSTGVFNHIWRDIGNNLENYRCYPRIVGETGGKNFHFIHESADVTNVVNQSIRGAFEYQGQKCSALSRMYVPRNLWSDIKDGLVSVTNSIKMGCSTDFSSFMCAVIDSTSFNDLKAYIEGAKAADDCEIIVGGGCDDSVGYYVEPTIIVTTNPEYTTMCDELFGPVLTVYVYEPNDFEETLKICDANSDYALTGSIFASDRRAVKTAMKALRNAAGNFYVNDKCTGATVGEQPFGGSRQSGTNDKSGTNLNLLRWTTPLTIKETFSELSDIHYPHES